MRKQILTLLTVIMLLPMIATIVSAQDDSHITVAASGAFEIDENYDGELDLVRVIASIGTNAPYAMVAAEVIALNDDVSLSFWNNTTLESGESMLLNTTIKAWADGDFQIWLRVWDAESGLLVHDEELGTYELIASLTPPQLSMDLESEEWIFTGDTCLIHRVSTDLVGAYYEEMGTVSIQGVPWLVGEYETPLDCSRWPAGQYTIVEHYRNGLGMTATETISFEILVHPPPSFTINYTGRSTETGTPCDLEIVPQEDTEIAEMSISWEVINPKQEVTYFEDAESLDCIMWGPGVHKIRTTLTSPQGRTTTVALNVIRLPPAPDASLDVLNASGDPERWPSVSEGDGYEPTPMLYSLSATIAMVGSGGFIVALILGLLAGSRFTGEKREQDLWDSIPIAPDSEGMPTYVDESGVHWRQQPDGSVDWWDSSQNVWQPFEE